MSDIDSPDAKEAPEDDSGNVIDSPTSDALCDTPFKDRNRCGPPADFKSQLNSQINMEGMLTFGAVSAFHYSQDDLFSKGKNFYYLDYSDPAGLKREYMQWDLNSTFGSLDANANMYNQLKGRHDTYEESLVEAGDAPFREDYNTIIEALLDPALASDPNSKNATESFGTLAAYVSARIASMRSQLPANAASVQPLPSKT